MSRPVRERLVELSAEVEQVRLAPAADVRARGRSRARRRVAATGAGLAVLVAAGGFGLTKVAANEPDTTAAAPPPSLSCDVTLPDDPSGVVIRVVGDRNGPVALDLMNRGFAADGRPGPDPDAGSPGPVAVIRYGPQAIGAATLVRALVDGDAVMKFLPDQTGRTVDLALGQDFGRLSTTTEVNQKLAEAGEPTRPPGC